MLYFSIFFKWTRRNRNLHARLSPCGGLREAISRHLRQDLRLRTSDLITLRDVPQLSKLLKNMLLSTTFLVEPWMWIQLGTSTWHLLSVASFWSFNQCRISAFLMMFFEVYNTSECDNLGSVSSGSSEDMKIRRCTSCLRLIDWGLDNSASCAELGFCVLCIMCIRAAFLTYDFYQFIYMCHILSYYSHIRSIPKFIIHWCFFMCCIFLLLVVALASDLMTSLQRRCQTNYEGTATGGSTSNQLHFWGNSASVKGGEI